jgi:hypothetical protein
MVDFENLVDEFLKAYLEKREDIPLDAWLELARYFPERYGNLPKTEMSRMVTQAGKDYLQILKTYLIYYKIPITIESITAGFDWGMGNLRKNGLYNAPIRVKQLIAQIRHSLEPQALMMEAENKD